MRPFGQRKLSGPLVLQSAATSLVATPGDCRIGDEYKQQTTAAQHQVCWRLIPAANDSPVVFTDMTGGNDDAENINTNPQTR